MKRILLLSVLFFGATAESSACFCDLKSDYKIKEDLVEHDFTAHIRILKNNSTAPGTTAIRGTITRSRVTSKQPFFC